MAMQLCKPGRGVLVVLEGLDGSGKTTMAKQIVDYLTGAMNYHAIFTREPGGTEFAMKARELLFAEETKHVSHDTQALVVAAARRDHVENVIMPGIVTGKVIVCDRYTLSTRMYQRDAADLEQIIRLGSMGVEPHVTLILDVDYAVSKARLEKRAAENDQSNWLDMISEAEFNARRDVLRIYHEEHPFNTFVIDANQDISKVMSDVHQWMTRKLLPLIGGRLLPWREQPKD